MCLKCNSCKNPLALSIDRANLEVHLICDLCNTSENHTLTATQIACIESLPPAERLRRVECFLTLAKEKSLLDTTPTLAQSVALDYITNPPPMTGGEAPRKCLHHHLTRNVSKAEWTCDTCGDILSSALFYAPK